MMTALGCLRNPRGAMCEHGNTVDCCVPVPADLAFEGELTWKMKPVDACLAPIVDALNRGGVLTRSCCCGHGKTPGEIVLHDFTVLRVQRTSDDTIAFVAAGLSVEPEVTG